MKGLKECTTLIYLQRNDEVLLLYRNRKENDENKGKYIGIGGHVEQGETPEECVKREVLEETGLTLKTMQLRGLLTFVFEDKDELAFLYTSSDFAGDSKDECNEGQLRWVDKKELLSLPLWEGDPYFLKKLINDEPYFSMKLVYQKDKLIKVETE